MYVKEDLIIPHHYTFYDFIVTKVSYPLQSNLKTYSSLIFYYRLEAKVAHSLTSTSTMTFGWSVMLASKKMNRTPVKYCSETGMRGTNTFSQHHVGNLMIRPKPTKSIASRIRRRSEIPRCNRFHYTHVDRIQVMSTYRYAAIFSADLIRLRKLFGQRVRIFHGGSIG